MNVRTLGVSALLAAALLAGPALARDPDPLANLIKAAAQEPNPVMAFLHGFAEGGDVQLDREAIRNALVEAKLTSGPLSDVLWATNGITKKGTRLELDRSSKTKIPLAGGQLRLGKTVELDIARRPLVEAEGKDAERLSGAEGQDYIKIENTKGLKVSKSGKWYSFFKLDDLYAFQESGSPTVVFHAGPRWIGKWVKRSLAKTPAEDTTIEPTQGQAPAEDTPIKDYQDVAGASGALGEATGVETKPQDEVSTKPQDEVATKPQDEVATKPQDEVATKPQDEVATKPQDEVATKPQDEVATKPQDEVATKPQDEVATKPQDEVATKPQDEVATKPQDETQTGPAETTPVAPPADPKEKERIDTEIKDFSADTKAMTEELKAMVAVWKKDQELARQQLEARIKQLNEETKALEKEIAELDRRARQRNQAPTRNQFDRYGPRVNVPNYDPRSLDPRSRSYDPRYNTRIDPNTGQPVQPKKQSKLMRFLSKILEGVTKGLKDRFTKSATNNTNARANALTLGTAPSNQPYVGASLGNAGLVPVANTPIVRVNNGVNSRRTLNLPLGYHVVPVSGSRPATNRRAPVASTPIVPTGNGGAVIKR